MTLFPFFVDLTGQRGLVVGGGHHALEKVERMLPYGAELKVIAPSPCEALKEICHQHGITLVCRAFRDEDLDPIPLFVITAIDEDQQENRRISALCQERRILVNAVDDQPACSFVFPSLIARGDLSIGISTAGASPGVAVLLRKKIESMLPARTAEILSWLRAQRPEISAALQNKKQRFGFYHLLAARCMEKGRPLEESEFKALISEAAAQSSR